ncbi:MAG TPA: cytochrome c-type biogenesis CcmF C-terminal domain-containing protein [Thermoleophilaceae bacterium]|nr:cytochrome c-type biogenesis CcmF C-terminal domain-containing protein [Thermoleophilaceae bacterium]
MAGIGSACLFAGLLTAVYAAGASVYGARAGNGAFVISGRRAIYCLAALMLGATAVLQSAFLRSDFSYALVAEGSSTDTPTFYKVTAMWATQDGSLLLWALLLSLFSSAVLFLTRRSLRGIAPYATAVLAVVAGFFLLLMVGWENPFGTLANPPAEGSGLNPLLRHPAMMIHPPMLYTGYVGFSIPFAFAVGALITRNTGADWIRATRRFALVAWTFLGTGIMLGALWSYTELGWGGYWAWDPVENASLMPWLVGTAFLHSIMVQEKRGMLKIWNVCLIIATFVLALLGTFLVRSGILDSIHAFGASTIGVQFLVFIALVVIGSTVLVISRLPHLRSEARLDSLLSREAFFLLNNLVLVGLCLVVFWGTFFPLISEAVTGTEASVGPPWFNRLTTPLALVLVLLMAIGPVVSWRRMSPAGLVRAFKWPVLGALLTLLVALALTPAGERPLALLMACFAALVLVVVGQEFWRGASARRTISGDPWPRALSRLVARNRRRYGGYIAHAGIVVLFLGVAGSSAFLQQRDLRLSPGDTFSSGGYHITYEKATATLGEDRAGSGAPITFGAVLRARDENGKTFTLRPSRNFYPTQDASKGAIGRFFEGEATSEVDVRWGLRRDLWTAIRPDISALADPIREANAKFGNSSGDVQALVIAALAERYRRNPPPATFRAIVSPLVSWIWIGGGIVLLGALIAAWPSPEARLRRVRSLYSARLGRDLRAEPS